MKSAGVFEIPADFFLSPKDLLPAGLKLWVELLQFVE